jgi:hypothetical protein
MTRSSGLTTVLSGENRPTTNADVTVLPAFSIAVLFVPSMPVTPFAVSVSIPFPIPVPLTVPFVTISFRVPLALTVLPVPLSVSMSVSATFALALRTLAAMLTSFRSIGVLSAAFTFETPVFATVHFATVRKSLAARSTFYARIPSAWSRRRGL